MLTTTKRITDSRHLFEQPNKTDISVDYFHCSHGLLPMGMVAVRGNHCADRRRSKASAVSWLVLGRGGPGRLMSLRHYRGLRGARDIAHPLVCLEVEGTERVCSVQTQMVSKRPVKSICAPPHLSWKVSQCCLSSSFPVVWFTTTLSRPLKGLRPVIPLFKDTQIDVTQTDQRLELFQRQQ